MSKKSNNKFSFLFSNKLKAFYIFLLIFVLATTTMGATYAYWVATASSGSEELQTSSIKYNINMQINPLYNGFSVIPMNDNDVLKALNNNCKDKYDRGACSAYYINVYGYSEKLDYISGYMDVTTNNMQNLSYMMLRLSEEYEEDTCIKVGDDNYCVVYDASSIDDGNNLSLGDSYDVLGMSETNFILVIWLSNLSFSQNDIDIGSFNAIITMQAGNGGEIKGSIADVIKIDDEVGDIGG